MRDEHSKPEIRINEPIQPVIPTRIDRQRPPIKGYEVHDHGKPADDTVERQTAHHTLQDMAKAGFEFFTPALICTHGRFDRDPVVEFNRQYPPATPEAAPAVIDYAHRFFAGLGEGYFNNQYVDWDRRLYAIRREHWELCRGVISGIVIMQQATRFYARVGFYEMKIVDPFALKKMTVVEQLPTVTITVFGVSSNNSFTYLKSRRYPQLPYVVAAPAPDNLRTEANSVLGPRP